MDDQVSSLPSTPPSADVSIAAPDPSPIPTSTPASPSFDPSRMIGIIKRKALIKKLAAAYHAQCLSYSQELLELQKNSQEPFLDTKPKDEYAKELIKPPKRAKKAR